MSFKDEIRQALIRARQTVPDDKNPYLASFAELAEALTTDSIVADVVASSAQRHTLRLWPRDRPAWASNMMSVQVESDRVVVLPDKQFVSRESFEEYLKNFVRDDRFLASLFELERQSQEPVEAYLRVVDPLRISRYDLQLVVTPEEQRRLADASEGAELELELDVGNSAGAGAYNKNIAYRFLNSAGVLLQVTDTATTSAERIRVKGRRIKSIDGSGSAYEHLPDEALTEVGIKLAGRLRGLVAIYRRDKRALDEAPDEVSRRKTLHYAADINALKEYIRDQYAMNGVQVRECMREIKRRLRSRMPEEPALDFFRPDDPIDIEGIADFLELAARALTATRPD